MVKLRLIALETFVSSGIMVFRKYPAHDLKMVVIRLAIHIAERQAEKCGNKQHTIKKIADCPRHSFILALEMK